MARLLSNYRTS